jgi:uncharacterized OsmC-like protein
MLRATGFLLENLYLEGRVGKLCFEADEPVEPVERGGTDLAPSPLEYFVIGAVFCLVTQVAQFAHLYSVPLEEVEVDPQAIFNSADKYGLTGQGAAFEQFNNKVNIHITASEEPVRLLVVHTERACQTSQSLFNPVSVIMEVQLNGSLIK